MYEREQSTVLSGRVEVDDAYLGGEHPGGKPGRGSENKTPFIAAVQTNKSGNPMYVVLSQVKAFTLVDVTAWARKSLSPFTTVVSDGMHCFNAVKKAGCSHQKVVVGYNRKSTCVFRGKSATHSDGSRPPIPIQVGHLFRLIPATP